jgi:predicted nucleic acid-binding protein
MRIIVDTNVITRTYQPTHPQYRPANEEIHRLGFEHELVVTPQVLYEFWAVATRPLGENGLGMPTPLAYEKLLKIRGSFGVLHDSVELLEQWSALVLKHDVKGRKSHDARLAAAAIVHQASLVTFNRSDFERYGIEIHSPSA